MTTLQKFSTVPIVAGALVLGIAAAGFSSLAFADTASTTQAAPMQRHDAGSRQGGHVGKNGVREELLTGDVAQKVTAAALAAEPGATIERVETDAEGAAYEAHLTKADGSRATLKFDANYSVTGTEDGPPGPPAQQ